MVSDFLCLCSDHRFCELVCYKRRAEIKLKEQYEKVEEKNIVIENKRLLLQDANQRLKTAQDTIAKQNHQLISANTELESKVKKRTSELRAAVSNLTAINKELDELIFQSSHNLKTPVTSLQGLSMLGMKECTGDIAQFYFQRIAKETNIMIRLQKNLMLAHEIKNQPMKLQEHSVKNIIDKALSEHDNILTEQKATIDIQLAADFKIMTQAEWLIATLSNLIENAICFAKEELPPHIKIDAMLQSDKYIFSITDNGIGIPKDAQEKVFEMFYRASSRSGGSGLGLFVCQLVAKPSRRLYYHLGQHRRRLYPKAYHSQKVSLVSI